MKSFIKSVIPPEWLAKCRRWNVWRGLPPGARAEWVLDAAGLPDSDPGIGACVEATLDWLRRAQDHSATHDGGFSRNYSLIRGWNASYPETTGYLVPTLLDVGIERQRADLIDRARRALDWLVSIQRPDGGFQGGTIGQRPVVSVTFNTGQILLGLTAGARHFGDHAYFESMHRAAVFLRDSQDEDGAWRHYPTPFAAPGDKTYETHASWGLFEADRLSPGHEYGVAGLRQVRWAITHQEPNGWFRNNDLNDPAAPLTHTIGYVVRGIIEAYRFSHAPDLLHAVQRACVALISCLREDGWLPGKLDSRWKPAADWVCLTGTAQIAACWFLLSDLTGDSRYIEPARRANRFVRRTVRVNGDPDMVGGVKGSFPIYGDYGFLEYLNWAAKFFIDAQRLEAARLGSNKIDRPAQGTGPHHVACR